MRRPLVQVMIASVFAEEDFDNAAFGFDFDDNTKLNVCLGEG